MLFNTNSYLYFVIIFSFYLLGFEVAFFGNICQFPVLWYWQLSVYHYFSKNFSFLYKKRAKDCQSVFRRYVQTVCYIEFQICFFYNVPAVDYSRNGSSCFGASFQPNPLFNWLFTVVFVLFCSFFCCFIGFIIFHTSNDFLGQISDEKICCKLRR